MRRLLLAALLTLGAGIPLTISGSTNHGYAQTGTTVQGNEFNSNDVAPFVAQCGHSAIGTCPDAPGSTTWNLNTENPGFLRIYTQPGTLEGPTNNARDFFVQPYSVGQNFTVTTKLTFPTPGTQFSTVGQDAGLLAYLNDQNFITVDRRLLGNNTQLEFNLESNDQLTQSVVVPEQVSAVTYPFTVYLQLTKNGNAYSAAYSYDGTNFTPFYQPAVTATPTATATGTATTPTNTPAPTATPTAAVYTADYSLGSPSVGVFAWGGSSAGTSTTVIPADFDWFRVGNPATPAPTALPTSTSTPGATSTPTVTNTPAATATTTPTSTALPTATSTNTPTATAAPTSTPTAIPTPTPRPVLAPAGVSFRYISIWYHQVRPRTFNHIEVQSSRRSVQGIWVHVYFASGFHYDYYENTDGVGHWVKEFNIPRDSVSRYSNIAVVTFQLWKGKRTAHDFSTFAVVR